MLCKYSTYVLIFCLVPGRWTLESHCDVTLSRLLFAAFLSDFVVYISQVYSWVYNVLQCFIVLVGCSFINMKYYSFSLIHFHSSCHLIWCHHCSVCLFRWAFLWHIFSFLTLLFCFRCICCISYKQHAPGMHDCSLYTVSESLSFHRQVYPIRFCCVY